MSDNGGSEQFVSCGLRLGNGAQHGGHERAMARQRTGTLARTRDGLWQPMVTFRGKRVRLAPLPRGTSEAKARDRAAYWAAEAARCEAAGLELDGTKPSPEPVLSRADQDAADRWVETWLAERRRRGHTSVGTDEGRWRTHIRPVLGDKHVATWTAVDLRRLVATLDEKVQTGEIKRPKTAQNVWITARAMCGDAFNSKTEALRVRDDNPATGVRGPDGGARRRKQFLFPSEFLRLVSCAAVPLEFRRSVAVAIYSYVRVGEHVVLPFDDIDTEHLNIHIHRALDGETRREKSTKGERDRDVPIEPNLLPLLQALHRERGGVGLVSKLPTKSKALAKQLRDYLKLAGVQRSELFEDRATTKRITWHDLRATGITWMAVAGVDPLKIMQRAGHENFSTTEVYIRLAESRREGFGTPFPPLPAELLGDPQNVRPIVRNGGGGGNRSRRTGPTPEKQRETDAVTQGPAGSEVREDFESSRSLSAAHDSAHASDDTERALSESLTAAAKAGRFDVVAQLAGELQARRLERSAGRVVALDAVKRSR